MHFTNKDQKSLNFLKIFFKTFKALYLTILNKTATTIKVIKK